jgi:hypothetical protein
MERNDVKVTDLQEGPKPRPALPKQTHRRLASERAIRTAGELPSLSRLEGVRLRVTAALGAGQDDVRFAVFAVEYHSSEETLILLPIALRGRKTPIVVSSRRCAMRIAAANGRGVLAARNPYIDDA